MNTNVIERVGLGVRGRVRKRVRVRGRVRIRGRLRSALWIGLP